MLTNKQIRILLHLTQQETVADFGGEVGYVVKTKRGSGYSSDPEIAAIQATLSMMLDANARAGREKA
jgi:hypothetical protein